VLLYGKAFVSKTIASTAFQLNNFFKHKNHSLKRLQNRHLRKALIFILMTEALVLESKTFYICPS
jgi:hypothetical protein